jgi:hypothetical protein
MGFENSRKWHIVGILKCDVNGGKKTKNYANNIKIFKVTKSGWKNDVRLFYEN